jgi:hypothetical protein
VAFDLVEVGPLSAGYAGQVLPCHVPVVLAGAVHVVREVGPADAVQVGPAQFGGDSGQRDDGRGAVAVGVVVDPCLDVAVPADRADLPDADLRDRAAQSERQHGVRGLVV